jgi:hypothetical protein
MGTETVPETSASFSVLTQLIAREDFINSCHRESFKSYNSNLFTHQVYLYTQGTMKAVGHHPYRVEYPVALLACYSFSVNLVYGVIEIDHFSLTDISLSFHNLENS